MHKPEGKLTKLRGILGDGHVVGQGLGGSSADGRAPGMALQEADHFGTHSDSWHPPLTHRHPAPPQALLRNQYQQSSPLQPGQCVLLKSPPCACLALQAPRPNHGNVSCCVMFANLKDIGRRPCHQSAYLLQDKAMP